MRAKRINAREALAGPRWTTLVRERDEARALVEQMREALQGLLDDLPVVRNAADWTKVRGVRDARAALAAVPDRNEDA